MLIKNSLCCSLLLTSTLDKVCVCAFDSQNSPAFSIILYCDFVVNSYSHFCEAIRSKLLSLIFLVAFCEAWKQLSFLRERQNILWYSRWYDVGNRGRIACDNLDWSRSEFVVFKSIGQKQSYQHEFGRRLAGIFLHWKIYVTLNWYVLSSLFQVNFLFTKVISFIVKSFL